MKLPLIVKIAGGSGAAVGCLRLHLMGAFRVTLDDQPVNGFRTQKARALLAYLAVEALPHERDHLAGLLWPDCTDPVARTYLRQALASLRRILDGDARHPPLLLADRHTIQLNPAAGLWLDTAALAKALAALAYARDDGRPGAIVRLEEAIALYKGDFLQGFHVEGCEAYQEWQLQTAEHVRRQMLDALARLSEWYGNQGNFARAWQYARRWVEFEPWSEEGHQQIMRMLTLDGKPGAALAHYDQYRRLLAVELDAAPAEETQALHESIQQRRLATPPAADAVPLGTPPNNLPAPLTPLVGRSREREVIGNLLRRPEVRLLTLTGTGGVGKTRLSQQVAADLLASFGDGVYFVGLAPVRDPELIPSVIANTLGLHEVRYRSALETLVAELRSKTSLLVLDNFEHIPSAASVVAELLRACPRLKILVTSREALRLSGEYEYTLTPLALPPQGRTIPFEELTAYGAIELYQQRALAANRDFALNADTGPAVVQICTRLVGLPLAIELAAARARRLSPQALAQQLERGASPSLRLLRASARDVPERHRSLWDAIAWSYDLLQPDDQALFRRLAVFVGGWTAEAVAAVCGVGPAMDIEAALESLADKHLVEAHPDGAAIRYTMLEPLREFGLELLAQAGELQSVQARMAGYFLELAEAANATMLGPGYTGSQRTLFAEHDNLRAALGWALANREADISLRFCMALQQFWNDYPREAGQATLQALAVAEGAPLSASYTYVLIAAGYYAWVLGKMEVAQQYFERGLAANEAISDRCPGHMVCVAYGILAWIMFDRGYHEQADAYHRAELAHAERYGDDWSVAMGLMNMGVMSMRRGDFDDAQRLLTEAYRLHRVIGQAWAVALTAVNLGELYVRMGTIEEAGRILDEGLALSQENQIAGLVARAKRNLGWLALEQADYRRAILFFGQGLEHRFENENPKDLGLYLELIARLTLKMDRPDHTLRLVGGIAELRRQAHMIATPHQQAALDAIVEETRRELGPGPAESLWAEGARMTLEALVQYGQDVIRELQDARPDARPLA